MISKSPYNSILYVLVRGTFLLILFLGSFSAYSQVQFHRLYARNDTVGPSDITGITELSNGGGYLLTGLILPCFNCTLADALAIKTDIAGDTIWTKRIGGNSADYFNHVLATYDGNYLLAGTSMSFGPQPMGNLRGEYIYLVKLTPSGDTIWSKIYGGTNTDYYNNNSLEDIKQTSDGGFILAAIISDVTNDALLDGLLIRLNANGDTLWTRAYGSGNSETILNVQETQDKGFILAADTASVQGMYYTAEAVAVKIDSVGNIQWQKSYGGNKQDGIFSISVLNNGDYIAAGQTSSFTSDSTKNYIYLIRLNSMGDTIWTRIYGPVYNFRYLNLINDSVALITGLSGTTNYGILAMKIRTSDGSILFSKEYGSPGGVDGVALTADGGFIFGTSSPDFGSSYGEGYVIKVDGNGNSGCNEYAISESSLPTQTNVGIGNLKIKPFPVIVQSTNTQIQSGLKIGMVCTNVGIEENSIAERLIVYPNPSTGKIYISGLPNDKKVYSVEVTDITGKIVVREQALTNNRTIEVNIDVDCGVYFIKLLSEDQVVMIDKIIINR